MYVICFFVFFSFGDLLNHRGHTMNRLTMNINVHVRNAPAVLFFGHFRSVTSPCNLDGGYRLPSGRDGTFGFIYMPSFPSRRSK